MQQFDGDISYILGGEENISNYNKIPVLSVFNDMVLDFLDDLSRLILDDKECRGHNDVLTFGFWCRKALILNQKKLYEDEFHYLGRGLVFHISPSNLPLIFAYSLVSGLLAGNGNIIRISSKEYWETDYLCNQIRGLLRKEKYEKLYPYITCIRYNRQKQCITKYLSSICDVRVIWGGDSSITEIRNHPLKPRAYDIVFANRYSLCIIDSNKWMECKDKKRYIKGFYNDTYLNDQNACSSPRLILWTGDAVEEGRKDFWDLLEEMVIHEYDLTGIHAVSKFEHFCRMIEKFPDLRLCSNNNYIVRVWAENIEEGLLDFAPGGGFFIESRAENIEVLEPLLTNKCQTLSYYGVSQNELINLLYNIGPRGIDRVVPIGHTLDFSLTWDGYDVIRSLSRKINII